MRKLLKGAFSILPLCLLCAVAPAQSPPDAAAESQSRKLGSLTFSPYKLIAGDKSVDAELGRLVVKENRKSPASNLIELAFVRLKSTSPAPGPPVVYLDGGPGSSAINLARAPAYFAAFMKLREVGDVILLDQRGIGLSRPNLTRISTESLPPDVFLNRETAGRVFKARAKEAADHFRKQGVDILAYNNIESAADLDDLRKALGAEKLNLVGFSYGTHLGLATIRYHGERLNRVVLIGTEGPDHTLKLPSTSQRQIETLSKIVAKDPVVGPKVPDLAGMIRRILDRLDKEPATVRITDHRKRQPVDVKVGKAGLQMITVMDLGDTNDLPIFPALFYTIDKGDYSILSRFVEKRYNQFGSGVSIMGLVMDTGSGATAARRARIEREAKATLLNDIMNFLDMGEALGNPDLGEEYRSPLRTNVPTLFISGTFDNNTPPFQADEVRKFFKQSTHVVVENAGHESMLVDARVQQVMVDYLRGGDLSHVKITLPPLKFLPIPESKPESR
jgi:pimeloyl-ACP methyl ester carboxylesterase